LEAAYSVLSEINYWPSHEPSTAASAMKLGVFPELQPGS